MLELTSLSDIALGHRAYWLRVAPSGWLVAATKEGHASVIGPDMVRVAEHSLGSGLKDVAISNDGLLLALVRGSGVEVLDARSGVKLRTLATASDRELHAARFTANDAHVWTASVALGKARDATIALHDVVTGARLRDATFPDPGPGSDLSLWPHPDPSQVTIWAAAGQDGQWILSARDSAGGIDVTLVPDLDDTTPPAFSPSGDEILLLSDDALERRRFPSFEQVGALATWPWDADDADEDGLGSHVEYISDARAVVSTSNGRLFVIDLARMEIADEAFVTGHAPRPVGELYPRLAEDTTTGSDLIYFSRSADGHVVSVHRELPEHERDAWRDRLVKWAR